MSIEICISQFNLQNRINKQTKKVNTYHVTGRKNTQKMHFEQKSKQDIF